MVQMRQAREIPPIHPAVAPVRKGSPHQAEQTLAGRVAADVATRCHLMQVVLRVVEQIAVRAADLPVRIFVDIVRAADVRHFQFGRRRDVPVRAPYSLDHAHQAIYRTVGTVAQQMGENFLEPLLLVAECDEHQALLPSRVTCRCAEGKRLAQQLAVVAVAVEDVGPMDMRMRGVFRQHGAVGIAADHLILGVGGLRGDGCPVEQKLLREPETGTAIRTVDQDVFGQADGIVRVGDAIEIASTHHAPIGTLARDDDVYLLGERLQPGHNRSEEPCRRLVVGRLHVQQHVTAGVAKLDAVVEHGGVDGDVPLVPLAPKRRREGGDKTAAVATSIDCGTEISDQTEYGLARSRVAALEIDRQYLPEHGAHRQTALCAF